MDVRSIEQAMNATDLDPKDSMNILADIEIQSQYLATSLDHLTENLCNLLHSISSITSDNVSVFRNTVNILTDTMDGNIRILYTIMAKTEEINKKFHEAQELNKKIQEIRRLVEMMDSI